MSSHVDLAARGHAPRRLGGRLAPRLVPWLLVAGCGGRPAPPPPLAPAPRPTAPAGTSEYPAEWGEECSQGDPLPFGRGRTVELATCADDPAPPDDQARPRQYTAYLVVRREGKAGKIDTTLTLGSFVVWEEGHEWKLVGTIESPTGAAAALAIYNDSGVGPGSSAFDLHAYALSDGELIDVYQTSASKIEVTVSRDRREATVELCSGCGDDGETTSETVELRFDGAKVIERRPRG